MANLNIIGDSDHGRDICPKVGTVITGDPGPDRNSIVQVSAMRTFSVSYHVAIGLECKTKSVSGNVNKSLSLFGHGWIEIVDMVGIVVIKMRHVHSLSGVIILHGDHCIYFHALQLYLLVGEP